MIKVAVLYDDQGAMCYVYRHVNGVQSLLVVGESGQEGAQTGTQAIRSARAAFKQWRKK